MNGHPAPCRRQVWQRSLPLILIALLAIAFLTVALLSAVALSGCGSGGTASTRAWVTVTDDDHNVVNIPKKPVRIVSTAPANTETLFALGVGNRVVGVTSLDDYPPEAAKIAKVGDFKLNTEAVVALNPDLIVGYSGNEEALAPLQKNNVPVIIFNPTNLDGIYANITTVGRLPARPQRRPSSSPPSRRASSRSPTQPRRPLSRRKSSTRWTTPCGRWDRVRSSTSSSPWRTRRT